MVAVNTTVEINCDGTWMPGVVIAESPYRLVIAVGGDRSRRAYIARITANWRTVPKCVHHVKDSRRRKAIVQAHNVFAGV
jgi:hypothetical protein